MSRAVRLVLRDLEAFASRQVGLLAKTIHSELVRTNPVDTGWSRSNWVPSYRSPLFTTFGSKTAVDPVSARVALSALTSSTALLDAPSYIVNSVPYIGLLNDGSSTQAPAGFVQRAIFVGVAVVS